MPSPFRIGARGAQNLVVGHGDGLADALFGGAGLALQARAHALHGDLGGLLAGGLAADAIHHQEDAALGVDVERVFVVPAHPAGVAGARAHPDPWSLTIRRASELQEYDARQADARLFAAPALPRCGRASRRPTNSMLEGAFSPLMVVPRRLRSLRKNLPAGRVAAQPEMLARNIRQGFQLQVGPVIAAAAAHHDLVLGHAIGLAAAVVFVFDDGERRRRCAAPAQARRGIGSSVGVRSPRRPCAAWRCAWSWRRRRIRPWRAAPARNR